MMIAGGHLCCVLSKQIAASRTMYLHYFVFLLHDFCAELVLVLGKIKH